MDRLTQWDISLAADRLKDRTFLLGNKRAFSLSLPASSGTSSSVLHPHKWFGAYLYGRKFLEGQVVRAQAEHDHALSYRRQTGLTLGLTQARRDYEVDGRLCSETFFVPDGLQGFMCSLSGDVHFTVEPEFDLRFYRMLNHRTDDYRVEEIADGVVVSNTLPSGAYDDETETFLPDGNAQPSVAFAAVQVVGNGAWCQTLPLAVRSRRKIFRKDFQRHRFLQHGPGERDTADHAPLSDQSSSRVYAPVRLHVQGQGDVLYGFGSTREEALHYLSALRESHVAFRAQKWESAGGIAHHAPLSTGQSRVDTAYMQVLSRLMDALVARHALAQDTALDRPATMILAGNQYFHDSWKRDENIALGFLLTLGFYDLARDVIRDTWQLQDPATGRLPQRIRAGESPPYHSSDGTLWALWRLHQYWRCTGDDALLYEKLPLVRLFFERSLERTVNGMLPSGRTTSPDYLWETWMDTPHTPRHGFPVEIQMLWIACLRRFRPLLHPSDPGLAERMERAESGAWHALQRSKVRGLPADSLDDQEQVRDLITPNPYFCFGIGLDLGPETELTMRHVGRRQLAGSHGIRTLAPDDWGQAFSEEFLNDRRHVRGKRMRSMGKFNYHRGVEWNWLSQFFVQADLKYGDPDAAFRTYLRPQLGAVMDHAGLGGISELHDLSGTRGPEYQAWSMSGFLESLHAFAGVQVDVPARKIAVRPQIPESWPCLSLRKWYGRVPFDLRYSRDAWSQNLLLEFSSEVPAEVNVELSLLVPKQAEITGLDLSVDGVLQDRPWRLDPIAGTERQRVCISVSACARTYLEVKVRKAAVRSYRMA